MLIGKWLMAQFPSPTLGKLLLTLKGKLIFQVPSFHLGKSLIFQVPTFRH